MSEYIPEVEPMNIPFEVGTSLTPIFKECDELFSKKNQDYASNEEKYKNFKYNAMIWGTEDWEQMLYRASEKMIRIANLKGKEANFEGIDDSMRDIITLTAMALDAYRASHEVVE